MRHTISGLAAATSLVAAAALTVVPTTSAVSASAEPGAPDPRARERWSTVSTGSVSLLAQPTALRTADGVLHVVHQQEAGSQDQYEHSTVTTAGDVGSHSFVNSPWGSLIADPKLLPAPGGMRLVFSGLQDTNTGNFFSAGRMYHALSDTTGAAWTIPAEALTKSASAYASYGTSAVALPDGTPVSGFPLNSGVAWRAGTIPAAALEPGNTTPPDNGFTLSSCCIYNTTMVESGGSLWMAWDGNGYVADNEGTVVRQIHPTLGPALNPPGALRVSGSQFDAHVGDQAVPMVSRPDGSVVLAYCIGTFSCERLMVWPVGSADAFEVRGARGAEHYAMDVTPSGRLWVAWTRSDEVYAARSSASGFRFGGVRQAGKPSGSSDLYKITVEATDRFADVLVNDGDRISHVRLEPGLLFSASPRRWDGDRAKVVKFKVTDAGDGVSGARVRAGGEQCRTNGAGRCSIRFAPRRSGRITATASKSGYERAKVKLKVTR